MKDNFLTLSELSEGLFKEKGSKFLGYAFPIKSEIDLKNQIERLKKEHHSARHFCYAFKTGINDVYARGNDDGEPAGTAGAPILGQINSFELTNIGIVVVRYFGGTKLGVRGLIDAYKAAAKEAIELNSVIEEFLLKTLIIKFKYDNTSEAMRLIQEYDGKVINEEYGDSCKLTFNIRASYEKSILHKAEDLHKIELKNIKDKT